MASDHENKNVAPISHLRPVKNNASESDSDDLIFYRADGKHGIRHRNGRLPEIVTAAGDALTSAAELNVFVRSEKVVRVHEAKTNLRGWHRPAGALAIHYVEVPHMVELLSLACLHEKWDSRVKDWVPIDCPRKIAETYMARSHWPELPTLSGFIEAPTISLSGRVIEQPGYDDETGLYLALSDKLTSLKTPGKTREEAEQAVEFINRLFAEDRNNFPFVGAEDRSAIIAAFITALVRRLLPSAPMFAITAPSAGTGKSKLADGVAMLATGRRASVMALGQDEAETQKRLGGVLLSGDLIIVLDNIEQVLGGELLCQVTTQPTVSLRPLGGSSVLHIPTNSMLLATGNNLSIVGDLKRRVVLIRLDAKIERPEQRTFDSDFIKDVEQQRGALISAALTIVCAYIHAGEPLPKDSKPAGSFEEWDRMVRRPLVWLGLPDPLGGAEALREVDPDIEAMRALFNAWIATPFTNPDVTVSQVVELGMKDGHGDLYDALQLVCSEKVNSRRLGYWLRTHRDRIVDDLQLKRSGADGHDKVARWRINKCG